MCGSGSQRVRLLLMAWAVLATLATQTLAFPVAFAFRGTVDEVFDGLGALQGRVAPGSVFHGLYVFESTTVNSAPPGGEGEFGIYHHENPPAGVAVAFRRIGLGFVSSPLQPDFDVIVNNDVGFAGADEYGFISRRNIGLGLAPDRYVDRLDVDWIASTFTNQVFSSPDLPLDPPDLSLLGRGRFRVYGECTPCAAPAAFFSITGGIDRLVRVRPRGSGHFVDDLGRDAALEAFASFPVPEPIGLEFVALAGLIASVPRSRRSQ